jgi:hypothetical protein
MPLVLTMNTNIVLDPPPDVDHFSASDSGSEEEDSDSDESLASLESDSEEHPPEKILFEIEARNQHIWYLVKWKDCPLLRSSWEGKDCFEQYPGILEDWVIEKERQKERKSQPFDLDAFKKACSDQEAAERQRRVLRRLRRKANRILSIISD